MMKKEKKILLKILTKDQVRRIKIKQLKQVCFLVIYGFLPFFFLLHFLITSTM